MGKAQSLTTIDAGFIRRYHRHTRGLAASFLFILPLLIIYEMGLAILRPPAASWAGDAIRWLLHGAFGRWGGLSFNLAVIAGIVASLLAMRRGRGADLEFYPAMLAESLIYSLLMVLLMPRVIRYGLPLAHAATPAPDALNRLILSIGAGVYEEIVFRLGLMSAIYAILLRITRESWFSTVVAILFSSVLFAAAHYLNGTEMPLEQLAWSFAYRAVAGIIFAAIYIYRGLGVACYTHAFYDVLVAVVFA